MTSYSVLTSQGKATVIATWPGEYADSHSTKVTTCADLHQATRLAETLTWVSELSWDAAAYLDIYDRVEAVIAELIDTLRGTGEIPVPGEIAFGDPTQHSHTGGVSADTLSTYVGRYLPEVSNTLARAQRLSVADELAADAAARADALKLLPTGYDPGTADSRIWQMGGITRATQSGVVDYLPEGAALWSARLFDNDRGPAERWGVRNILHRLDQLGEAAKLVGGRGGPEFDPFGGDLRLPLELFGVHVDEVDTKSASVRLTDPSPVVEGSELVRVVRENIEGTPMGEGIRYYMREVKVYVRPVQEMHLSMPWDRDVFTELEVSVHVLTEIGSVTVPLATLDAADSDGFTSALGNWVGGRLFRS
jgi:hypothetical protein